MSFSDNGNRGRSMSTEHVGHFSGSQSLVEGLCISHDSLGYVAATNNSQISVAENKKIYDSCYKSVARRFCSKWYPLRNPASQGLRSLGCCQSLRQGEEKSASHAVALQGFQCMSLDRQALGYA